MAQEIVNKLRSTSIIKLSANTGTISADIGLSALSSNVAVENVSSATIRRIMWSSNTAGPISISRNNAVEFTLHGNGYWALDDLSYQPATNLSSNIVVSSVGTATIIIEVSKQAAYANGLIGM